MTDYVKQAVLGTQDYHATMRQAAQSGLQRLAGRAVEKGEFADDLTGHGILYEYDGQSGKVFHALSKFIKGYGWIAGGSALHFVHKQKIGYGDIDVFCVSEYAYETLQDCFRDYITQTNKRSCVAENAMFGLGEKNRYRLDRSLNLVSPISGQDWTHPANVLKEFDISCAAVAIVEPGLAYTLHRDDVMERRINYIGNCRNPVTFWRRVMKYYQRGFFLGGGFFCDLINDPRTRELVYMARDMYDMNTSKNKIDSELLWACWAINDYESDGTEETDSIDQHEYDEGWY